MAVVKELIRTEENGAISFGDYELAQKSKLSDYQHQGDMYKVKTFKEIRDRKMHRSLWKWNQIQSMKCLLSRQAQEK